MGRMTRATLVFPRTGQVIKVAVPVERYGAILRRNEELILRYWPKVYIAEWEEERRKEEEFLKIAALSG